MLKVTCAIIVRQNKILLTQKGSETEHPFQWEFPGGKVGQKETFVDCIIREIKEELNVEIKVLEAMISVKYDYGFKKIELLPFLCEIQDGEIVLTEHHDCRWLDLKELKEMNLSAADKRMIKQEINIQILEKYFRENMHNPR